MKVTSLQLPLHRLHPMLIDMLSHFGQSHFSSHLLQRQDAVDRDVPFDPVPLHIILNWEIKLYEKSNRKKCVVCKGVTFELSSDQYCCWGIFLA